MLAEFFNILRSSWFSFLYNGITFIFGITFDMVISVFLLGISLRYVFVFSDWV